MKKRIITMLLVVALAVMVSLLGVQADSTEKCPHCGQNVTFEAWDGTVKSGHFYMTGNYTGELRVNDASVDMVLDLRGNTISNTATGSRAVRVDKGALAILDTDVDNNPATTGLISGNCNSWGGAIYQAGGTLKLYGGVVEGTNTATQGGVLHIRAGEFTMEGGTLKAGDCSTSGGTIFGYGGALNLNGGTIEAGTVGSGKNGRAIFAYKGGTTACTVNFGSVSIPDTGKNSVSIGSGATVTLQDAPVIGHLSINAGSATTVNTLTDGANVYLDGDITLATANDQMGTYLEKGYIKPYGGGKVFAIEDNKTLTREAYECPCCDSAPTWVPFEGTMEDGKHYYLTGDYHSNITVAADTEVTLDLCGHNIQVNSGRAFMVRGTLNMVDSGKTGTATGGTTSTNGGVFSVQATGTLNLFGGTYVAAAAPSKGSVIYAIGDVNVYGGVLDGSTANDNTKACGTIYLNGGNVVISNGEIKGATAASGGSIYVEKGNLTVAGGTISGGSAANMGDDIYAAATTTEVLFTGGTVSGEAHIGAVKSVTVSGKPVLGKLKIANTLLTVGVLENGADISVAAEGVFTAENENIMDYAGYFHPVNPDMEVAVVGNTLAVQEPALCPHCGEKMSKIDWQPFVAGTAKDANGHYYLTGNVSRTTAQFIQTATDLVIDLRGHGFNTTQQRSFLVKENLTLSIMDSVGGGYVTGVNSGNGGVYNVVGTLNLYGGTHKAAGDSEKGSVVYVQNGGTLNIFDGAKLDGNEKTGSAVYTEGAVVMTGGTIQNGKAEFGGNVYVAATGEFTMSGGTVQNGISTNTNSNYKGGADNVYLDGGSMTMSAGHIIVASSAIRGDAILGRNGATLNLTATDASVYHDDMRGNVLVDSSCTFDAAAGATVVNRYSRQYWYNSNFQAVNNYEKIADVRYIKLYNNTQLAATKNLCVDINGHQMKIVVSDGVTLEGFDSTATLETPGTGKANVVLEGTGSLNRNVKRGDDRFVALTRDGLTVFHRITIRLSQISLRPGSAGVYYTTLIQGDPELQKAVTSYGVALSLVAMPGEDFADEGSTSLYTQTLTNGDFVNGTYTSALVDRILTQQATNNAERGKMKIYANAYITVDADGANSALVLSDTDNPGMTAADAEFNGIAYSLYDMMNKLDEKWDNLSEKQQGQVQDFYETWYTKGIDTWKFDNIRVLEVGFGRADITPNFAVHIAGGNVNSRIYDGSEEAVLDPLYTTCVAITDEKGETVLLITQDLVSAAKNYTTAARQKISAATNVPVENILISATHTHSAPDTANYGENGVEQYGEKATGVWEYRQLYFEKAVEAAQAAMADRSMATAATGTAVAKTENGKDMVFVRRYVQADGGYRGGLGSNEKSALVDSIYDANSTMQIINFQRPVEGKKDILFTNLGAHATFNGVTTQMQLSADFPGAIRSTVESSGEYLSAHFISAGADQNPESEITAEKHGLDYVQYGNRIGQIALDAVENLETVALGDIQVKSKTVTAEGNTEDIEADKADGTYETKLENAKQVKTYFDALNFDLGETLAKMYGFKGIYDAIGYIRRSEMAQTREITISTLTVGDMAFALAPYEMFGGNAKELIEASPYENTFIITCCNGADGYVPKEGTYAYGCYESYTSYVAEGTAEILVNDFVALLNESKNG